MERLASVSVSDEEGVTSDRLELELNDSPPAAIPRQGAVIGVRLGYGDALSDMGEFIAEEVELRCFPFTMRISGKSADLGGSAKDQKERHWDNITLGALVTQIASEHGFAASVDPSLSSFTYPYLAQVGEGDLAFLERLAQRHNALFAIKARTVVFAVRGSGLSPLGSVLTGITITPQNLGPGSATVTFSERTKYKEVVAVYMDRATGKRVEVTAPGDPAGEGDFTMDQPFGTEAEARAAAASKAAELKRRAATFTATIIGEPAARAGAEVRFSGVRPGIDGLAFVTETARHDFSKSGYMTTLSGSIKA